MHRRRHAIDCTDMPLIAAHPDDVLEHDVPGYDLHRLILARDPLAFPPAFLVQILQI